MARQHTDVFLKVIEGAEFAQPNPRPMFPNPPGLLRLEPFSAGLRDRIWWGAASDATAVWTAQLGMNLMSSTLLTEADGRTLGELALPGPAGFELLDFVSRREQTLLQPLAGLPPATVINARIDPLLSEGEDLARALQNQGVETTQKTYDGVAHEFFGMGAVVPQAKEAMTQATTALTGALASVLARCSYLRDGVAVRDLAVELGDAQTVDVLPPFAGG